MKIIRKIALSVLFSCSFAALAAEDVVITEAGTTTLPSGAHTYGQIVNNVSAAEVTVAQEGSDWNTFATLEAANASTTKLDNVRFDFNTTSASTLNFFPTANTGIANRLLEIGNGSVVTNVGCLVATRSKNSADKNNGIRVTGGSSLSTANVILGYDDPSWGGGMHHANNGAFFTLDGGSSLNCKGAFQTGNSLQWDTTVRDVNIWARFLGAGTTATIGGTLSVGGDMAYGGNHCVISDGAVVKASGLKVGADGSSRATTSFRNTIAISNGAVLETTAFSMAAASVTTAKPCEDRLEILDGGAYTNAGNFTVGYSSGDNKSKWGMSILVSNGTFRTSGGNYKFGVHSGCSNNTFTVAGPKANVTFFGGDYYYFCGGPGSRYVFEDRVDFTTGYTAFSYTASVTNEEIRVRTGATFRFPGESGFKIAATGGSATVADSRFVVESGATATGSVFRVGGRNNTLAVSNALVRVSGHPNYYYALDIGDAASGAVNKNAHLILSGDAPKIVSPGMVQIVNGSDVTFELPAAGYADGIIPITLDNNFSLNSGCSLNLTGAEEMLKVHGENKWRKRSYTLIKALSVNISAAEIERVNETLPDGMSLRKVRDGVIARDLLILDVKPKFGLLMIFR